MNRREFADPAELSAWLAVAGIDTSAWGRGEAKGLSDLWQEYVEGESTFQDDPPLRVLAVAQVILRRGPMVLLELAQELTDGRRRVRHMPPSEKLKGDEAPQAAAWRCLHEELGLGESDVLLDEASQIVEGTADAPSYPGLTTRYVFHQFAATSESLPDEDFYLTNAAPGDPVRRHLWGWREE
jgi:hypothetical protein